MLLDFKQYVSCSFSLAKIIIHPLDFSAILNLITNALEERKKLIINYAHFYSVVLSENNDLLRRSLSNAHLVHSDGMGIWLALKILYKNNNLKRFNWTDFGYEFIEHCERNGWKIFFLGTENEILMKAEEHLKKKYSRLRLMGWINGYEDLEKGDLVETINKLDIDILYVGMGTPKQEIWIYNNADKLNCRIIQSVGDLFRLFAKEKIRGPKLFRKVGLEWFFRLLSNPLRYYRRYLTGIPRFIIIVAKEFFKKNNG